MYHVTKLLGGRTPVLDLSLSFYKNNVTVVVGMNGSGKSMLLALISGKLTKFSKLFLREIKLVYIL